MKEYERWTEWVCKCGNSMKHRCTSGAQRTWVGLTDEDLYEIYNKANWDVRQSWDYERAIEAKLKEKEMTDCPNCEYHKNRAARWRAEAYKQAGHDVIERPWVGLTDEEIELAFRTNSVMVDNGNAYMVAGLRAVNIARAIEAKLKEKNT